MDLSGQPVCRLGDAAPEVVREEQHVGVRVRSFGVPEVDPGAWDAGADPLDEPFIAVHDRPPGKQVLGGDQPDWPQLRLLVEA